MANFKEFSSLRGGGSKILKKTSVYPSCPVASENGTGVAPEDGTGVKSDFAFI
jgi:hypothetical protein